eukprot:TRINITY_DN43151_c0_g1_i1.p1 TRINITY_DN43151_c0_g1~~TRINITY_DN43151_c0_g1_i1.p1  ORF type:complete len:367 (+),score=93.82 TRINITY_DN43151_c0_g1_i1:55-1155(+)
MEHRTRRRGHGSLAPGGVLLIAAALAAVFSEVRQRVLHGASNDATPPWQAAAGGRESGIGGTAFAGVSPSSSHLHHGLHPAVRRPGVALQAEPEKQDAAWQEAAQAEQDRTQLLLQKLTSLEKTLGGERLPAEAAEARQVYEESSTQPGADVYQRLRACNERLEEGIRGLETLASTPNEAYEFAGSTRLTGIDVPVDVLPPVWDNNDPALVPGAPHVRVSLPLDDAGNLMWGSDLTPFFDDAGDRLIAFHANLPLGMKIAEVARPAEAPEVPGGQVIIVEGVGERSEAERLGIRAGDYLRAVSRMGPGIEPDMLNKFLGAPTIPLKEVLKCDDVSIEEVTDALLSHRDSPDGQLTLLFERPPSQTE